MNKLSFDALRNANVKRCEDVFHPVDSWSLTDWATAMAGECGEACNDIKKLRRLDGADKSIDTPSTRQALTNETAKELADLVIYADLLAARMGIDLGQAVVDKFNEVSEKRGSVFTLDNSVEMTETDRLEIIIDRMADKLWVCTLQVIPVRELCLQIEQCGSSVELTKASTMACDILHNLMDTLEMKTLPPGAR